MPLPEPMLDALAEMLACQSRVARAESALLRAKRDLSESLARLARMTADLPAGVALPPTVTAALQLREELPEAAHAGDPHAGTLRDRIVALMEKSPDEIYTPARIAPLIGATNRDSIRNTLLVLAARGRVKKVGDGKYQARPKEEPPPEDPPPPLGDAG
jgi:hypothetical protein